MGFTIDNTNEIQPISGTVTANQGGTWNVTNISGAISLPTGAATSALQTTGNSSLATIASAVVSQGSSTSGQVGKLQLGAVTTAAPAYSNGQSSALSLTTAGGLRVDGSATTQPVSGTITANQGGTWTVTVSGTVSVSGTVAATQSGAWNVGVTTTVNNTDGSGTGTITALNGEVDFSTNGASTLIFSVSGTWSASLIIEALNGAGNWFPIYGYLLPNSFSISTFNTNINGIVPCGGYSKVRIRAYTFASGTVSIAWNAGIGPNWINVVQPYAGNLQATVTQQGLTKGSQGSNGVSTQDLKDAGRNVTNYFMASQVVSTATETLQSLTGYKSGAAVAATTTPAVVTSGKTYRVERLTITYVAVSTAGSIQVNLRANSSGVVAIGSPLVDSWLVGAPAATAGVSNTVYIEFPDGLEFPAGTGLGITVLGVGATGTATAVGYAKIAMSGYEY